jgi:hypothetical protein
MSAVNSVLSESVLSESVLSEKSVVNGKSFAAFGAQPSSGGAGGDNGQLRVVVSDKAAVVRNNTKDRARARASR